MYEFDPRSDDPRDDDRERDLSRGSRGDSDSREREAVDPRDVFMSQVYLPRGLERERVEYRSVEYTLRGSAPGKAAVTLRNVQHMLVLFHTCLPPAHLEGLPQHAITKAYA